MSFYRDQTESLFKSLKINLDNLENELNENLDPDTLEFITKSDLVEILAKFESTLEEYCQIMLERIDSLDSEHLQVLLFTLHHLNKMEEVELVHQKMKTDVELFNSFQCYSEFKQSDNIIKGEFIHVRYDENLENIVPFLLSDIDKIESFLLKHWKQKNPPNIYVTLLDTINQNYYNPYLHESFIPIGQYYSSNYNKIKLSKLIIHDFLKFTNITNIESISGLSLTVNDLPKFRFIEEGFTIWNENEYEEVHFGASYYANYCAYHLLKSGIINLDDIGVKWFSDDISKYFPTAKELGTSFIYYLIDRFGVEKVLDFFGEEHQDVRLLTWNDYIIYYFQNPFSELRADWKKYIFENVESDIRSSHEIISYLRLEKETDKIFQFYFESNSPISGNLNVFVYDDKGEILRIKDQAGRFIVERKNDTENLHFYITFKQYKQYKSFYLKKTDNIFDFTDY
jgi:hypothetical protein